MSPSTRRKILIGAGSVVGVLIVALLAAPAFVDLDKFKPELIATVKTATGRDLVVEGPVSLSLLPVPSVSATGVKFFNVAGAKNPNMVEVRSVTVRPALFALLSGDIEVNEMILIDPKIVLEINAQGKPNWEFTPSLGAAKPAAVTPSSPKPSSLGRLTIENGTLVFSDSRAGLSLVAEKASFTASVGSADGPYALAGGATVNGAPLDIDLSVGSKGTDGHTARLAFEAGGGKLDFKGSLSELGPDARVGGVLSASADSLTGFAGTLIGLAGKPVQQLPSLLAGKFSFDGGIDASQTMIAAKDFKLALASDNVAGSLSVTLKPELAIDGKLVASKVDLDATLAALNRAAAAPAAGKPGVAAPAPTPAESPSNTSYLAGINAAIAIEVGEVIYNKTAVRNVAIELEARGGAVAVPRLAAILPGDMVLQARSTMSGHPAKPSVSGDFSLAGPRLRDTLKWLELDVAEFPSNKLSRLSLKGRMTSAGGNVQVSAAAFELDDLKGTGGVTIVFSVPLSIVANLEFDTVDLDTFLARPAGDARPSGRTAAATPRAPRAVTGPTVGLEAKVAKLIYNNETIGGVDVDVALRGDTLAVNDIKVSNLAGARLAVRGSVANYDAPLPRMDIAFNFEAPDMGRVLKVAGSPASPAFGPVTASGGVSGTVEALTFRELNVAAQGQTVRVNGTLTMPGAARGQASSIGYKGSVMANGQTLEGAVDAKLGDRPHITADLRTTLLDLDKLGGASAPVQPMRGRPAPAAAAAGSVDSAPLRLRSVDASIKLVAATLVSSPLRLSNADLAATLKDGVLTIQHFKGGLYGGALELSGVVNASQPTLSFDFTGNASNIYIGEMLRATSGTNQFGGAFKITVDGRLNASGLTLKGAGITSAQLRSSMAGGAQLGGHLYIGADKTLTTIGSAASGVVGGVIDNTLGSALGIVGQRGGIGVGNLLNAASLVLNRFVNRDNPISGHVDIAGGVLTDKGLAVQGNGATANVATRTNLAASSTDTTVNIMINEDGSAPYLTAAVRGPFSSLSYNVTRGTAKDPPGMVNTLTNAITGGGLAAPSGLPIPNIPIPIPIPNLFGR